MFVCNIFNFKENLKYTMDKIFRLIVGRCRKILKVRNLPKDLLCKIFEGLILDLNYGWFKLEEWIEEKLPGTFQDESSLKMFEEFGFRQAKRLKKILNVSGTTVDDMVKLLRHSHWAFFENIEIFDLKEKNFRVRTIDCSLQKALKRKGKEYHDCRISGLKTREGFFKAINPRVKVQRIFSPPEPKPKNIPENVSCEWLIFVEE